MKKITKIDDIDFIDNSYLKSYIKAKILKLFDEYSVDNLNMRDKSDTFTVEGVNADLRHYIPVLARRRRCFPRSLETLKAVLAVFVDAYNRFHLACIIFDSFILSPNSRSVLSIFFNCAFGYSHIVGHVHDEIIVECEKNISVDRVCGLMEKKPAWADGLLLRADGYECDFYMKQ